MLKPGRVILTLVTLLTAAQARAQTDNRLAVGVGVRKK